MAPVEPFRAPHRTGWYIGISAYWFSTSFKWFILLLGTLAAQVALIVPEGERNTAWGQVVALGACWAVIGPALFGWISDRTQSRFGRRRLFLAIGAGTSLIALFTLFMATEVKSLGVLMLGYLLLQISDDVGTGPYSALIPEAVEEEHRGAASGILGQMRLVAQIASGVMGLVLSGNLLGIYVGIAIVNVIGALITLHTIRGIPDRPLPPRPGGLLQNFATDFKAPWRSRDFRLVFVVTFVGNLGYYIVQTFLPNFLRERIGDPEARPAEVANYEVFGRILDLGVMKVDDPVMAVYFLGLGISVVGILGALWCAKVSDRIGRKRAVLFGGVLMGVVLFPLAVWHDFQLIVLLAPLFGFGYGVYTAASWALVSDVLPDPDAAGKDMGVWQAAWSSVQIPMFAIGPMIDGANRTSETGLGYTIAFAIGAFLVVLGAVLVKTVRGST